MPDPDVRAIAPNRAGRAGVATLRRHANLAHRSLPTGQQAVGWRNDDPCGTVPGLVPPPAGTAPNDAVRMTERRQRQRAAGRPVRRHRPGPGPSRPGSRGARRRQAPSSAGSLRQASQDARDRSPDDSLLRPGEHSPSGRRADRPTRRSGSKPT